MPPAIYERDNTHMRYRFSLMRAQARLGIAASLCVLALAACTDRLLSVKDPDVANPGTLTGADKLPTQLASAIGDFQVGFSGDGSGGNEGVVNMMGLMTDEFDFTESFPTRIVVDQRNMVPQNVTLTNIFFNISRARATAARASDQYNQFDAANIGHSQVLSLEAYAQLLMAEMYCGAVPFSTLNPDGSVSNGTPLTTAEMLQTAVATFDSAISIAAAARAADSTTAATTTGGAHNAALAAMADDIDHENLARVGKGRALVNMGGANLQVADSVVASVATDFEYAILSSANTNRENNGIWEMIFDEGRWSVADSEGINGLNFVSAGDPRVVTDFLGTGFVSNTQVFGPDKYSDRSSPTVLSSGIEARLIQAEAALARSDGAWLTDLNTLRSGSGLSLGALSDPGSDTARVNLVCRERAFWVYATGHRLGDLRRLARSTADGGYGRPAESVFPTGPYHYRGSTNGIYGNNVSFPIPIEEGNNPDFAGTTCDLTVP